MSRTLAKGGARRPAQNISLSELVFQVFIMGRFMREKMHRTFGKENACGSFLEMETLRYVRENGKPLMHEVAKNFHMSPPAATLLIDNLVRAGLLSRESDAHDRRSVRIGITPRGKKSLDAVMTVRMSEMKKIFRVLGPSERTQFAAIIGKIVPAGNGGKKTEYK